MTDTRQTFSVAVVEDHDLVRDALVSMIERHPCLELVGHAGDGASAISLFETRNVDIAIVDFALPDMTGLEIISQVRKTQPSTRHLILTGSPINQNERERLAEFAEGFMHKEAGRDVLLKKLLETAEAPPLRMLEFAELEDASGFIKSSNLTKRERSVLREIAKGHSIDEIAFDLNISPSTVRKHRENIMAKLNLNSTAQLVRAAMQIGQY